ncbi:MAG: hypothetical protein FWD12_06885 [Alphaproteobacteria bacterium]|nr:hypothetical protein [Alphaproteobacteria bacterium]
MQTPPCAAVADFIQRQGTPAPAYADEFKNGSTDQCILESPRPPDFVITDVSGDACAQTFGQPTAGMWQENSLARRDYLGPVEVTSLVVPAASTETSISADAAYVVFGFAGMAQYTVLPWSDPGSIFVPWKYSGPLNLVASAIGLSPQKWAVPMQAPSSTDTILSALLSAANAANANMVDAGTALDAAPPASRALGIVANQDAEPLGTALRPLAYQHTGQQCGYTPSSDAAHRDLINVRQGRYALWSPVHVLMAIDVVGQVIDHTGRPSAPLSAIAALLAATGPSSPGGTSDANEPGALDDDAAAFDPGPADASFDADAGDAGPPPALDPALYFTTVIRAGLVPWCAMQVARSSDGAEMSYQPAEPCGCSYESIRGATLEACSACRQDSDCNAATPKCRFGYCEIQ